MSTKDRSEMTPDEVSWMREYGRSRYREVQCRKCRHVEKSHVAGGCVTQDGDRCGCLQYVRIQPAPRSGT